MANKIFANQLVMATQLNSRSPALLMLQQNTSCSFHSPHACFKRSHTPLIAASLFPLHSCVQACCSATPHAHQNNRSASGELSLLSVTPEPIVKVQVNVQTLKTIKEKGGCNGKHWGHPENWKIKRNRYFLYRYPLLKLSQDIIDNPYNP